MLTIRYPAPVVRGLPTLIQVWLVVKVDLHEPLFVATQRVKLLELAASQPQLQKVASPNQSACVDCCVTCSTINTTLHR